MEQEKKNKARELYLLPAVCEERDQSWCSCLSCPTLRLSASKEERERERGVAVRHEGERD